MSPVILRRFRFGSTPSEFGCFASLAPSFRSFAQADGTGILLSLAGDGWADWSIGPIARPCCDSVRPFLLPNRSLASGRLARVAFRRRVCVLFPFGL
jgi:hypothetical protein